MTDDDRSDLASITERVKAIAADAPVVAIHFVGARAGFILGEEAILLVDDDGERRIAVHAGAGILSAGGDGKRIVTGGDDGTVRLLDRDGAVTTLAADAKKRWIDRVALAADGAVAWAAGKQAFVKTPKGAERTLDLPSSAGGLAFAPKGFRLGIAHYNGASLWFPNASAAPDFLEWKGSHLDIAFSPDGRFLVTAMQEAMLHGWRLVDAKHMRMSGYAAKVQSMSWSVGGKWLATSGANQLVLWPFASKDGPMGKSPKMLAPADCKVSAVACHPAQEVAAVGFENGMLLMVRLDDGAEILAKRPGEGAVSAIAWSARGDRLAFGTEAGEAGILKL